jgi:predicted ATPase/DNA-binding winged helix-turn-helix (wHTH) protein
VTAARVTAAQGPIYASEGWEADLDRRELRLGGVPVPIGTRAFDLFEVLVRSAGDLVTKDELMSRVWSGAIVEESTLQVHISAIRKALGKDRGLLKTAFGRGYRLLGAWKIRPESTAQVPLDSERPQDFIQPFRTNVPVTASALIGRTRAKQHLVDVLSAYRVVTLTGAGGIGKSVLGLEVARNLFPTYEGDCSLVELASLSDPGLLPSAVARILGLRLGGDNTSGEAVARAIGERKLLLILDNCEHIVDAAAALVEAVVRMCPRTTVLATSRETLRIDGEHVYRVPPLDVPPEHENDASSLLSHSAVQLFIARMMASDTGLSAHPQFLPTIAVICRRLDGIPLAIEFAAARTAALGLQQVAARLDDRFRLLTAGRRTALPRHRTLRATLDWSYQLLPEAEQSMLRRLAIFAGGFTLEAATAVLTDADDSRCPVVEGIASLVGKSLLALDASVPSGRWRLLETIRAYAFEKLVESGEAEQVARRHAEFFRGLLASATSAPHSQPGLDDVAHYAREIDNVRNALNWAFSPAGDTRIGVELTAGCIPMWMRLALMVECRDRIERALEGMGSDLNWNARLRMQLQIGLGIALIVTMGPIERGRTVLAAALQTAESLDDIDAQARALWAQWALDFNVGDSRAAQFTAERFSRIADRLGDPAIVPVADRIVGYMMYRGGNQREARRRLERVLEFYAAPQDRRHRSWFLYDQRVLARGMLARPLLLLGFVDQAKNVAQASLTEAQTQDDKLAICFVLKHAVCPVAIMTGDRTVAERAVRMLINISTRHSFPQYSLGGRCLEATLMIRHQEFEAGTALLTNTLEMVDRTGWTIGVTWYLGTLAEGFAGLGRITTGLATVDKALAIAERGGELWCLAELLRIKASLLLHATDGQSISAAEDCFHKAVEVARDQ